MTRRRPRALQCEIERKDLFYEGVTVRPVETDLHIQSILLANGGEWFSEEDGRIIVRVTRPLFDAIPHIDLPLGDTPDAEDLWEEFAATEYAEHAIYAAVGLVTGLVKIGYTSCLSERMRRYSTESAEPMTAYTMPGTPDVEKILHRHFAEIKCPHRREWFYPHPSLLSYVLLMI